MLAGTVLLALVVQVHCRRAAALFRRRLAISPDKSFLELAPVCTVACPGRFFWGIQ